MSLWIVKIIVGHAVPSPFHHYEGKQTFGWCALSGKSIETVVALRWTHRYDQHVSAADCFLVLHSKNNSTGPVRACPYTHFHSHDDVPSPGTNESGSHSSWPGSDMSMQAAPGSAIALDEGEQGSFFDVVSHSGQTGAHRRGERR